MKWVVEISASVRMVAGLVVLASASTHRAMAQSGCAAVFRQQVYDPNAAPEQLFPHQLRLSRDGRTLVASNNEFAGDVVSSGSGYVVIYDIDSTGAVTETARIDPSLQLTASAYGSFVDLSDSGDVIVVGAPGFTNAVFTPPWVYVHREQGGTWYEEVALPEPQGTWANQGFGQAVAISGVGRHIVLGSAGTSLTATASGCVFPYTHDGLSWVPEVPFAGHDSGAWNWFGTAVSVDRTGTWLAVSAAGADSNTGAVYVFERVGTAWQESAKLTPSLGPIMQMGLALDMDGSGSTIVAGSHATNSGAPNSGVVAVFRRITSFSWIEDQRIPPQNVITGGSFGRFVDIDDEATQILIHPSGSGPITGSAYRYVRGAVGWQFTEELIPPTADPNDGTGRRFAMDGAGHRIAVSVSADDTAYGTNTGSFSLFELPCAAPFVYCTAKTNSLGCVPAAAFSGTPSASAGSGFVINASQVRNQTAGILFYSQSGRAALPFQGAYLCAAPPHRRTPIQFSGGTPAPVLDCSGTFVFDINAWAATATGLAIGERVQAQFWSRDTLAQGASGLTDAVDFQLAP